MTTHTKAAPAFVADICLYGGTYGAGWLAQTADGRMFGDGNPREGVSLTQAVWTAIGALSAAGGLTAGAVRVFEPSGRRMAVTTIERPLTVGDMSWRAAPVYVISAEALEAAGETLSAVRTCAACGSEYLATDRTDAAYHEAAECVGGRERFNH